MEQVAIRPATTVLTPSDLGGAWPDRHSFARTMLRRAGGSGWRVQTVRVDVDADGVGEVEYRVLAEGHEFGFLGITHHIDESQRTDRVVAKAWDVTAVLFEGDSTPERLDYYRREVPLQERGRMDTAALVLTRANRSGRHFESVVDELAAGRQPDLAGLGPCPYLVRSTAFYSNGKFGLHQFADFDPDHPLAAPYRAQMLAAWLLRELGFDLVDATAAQRSPDTAVRLNPATSRIIGIGNATGLGMVPVIVNHPDFLDAWCRVREVPLAAVLAETPAPADAVLAALDVQLERAERFLLAEEGLSTEPFLSPGALLRGVSELRSSLAQYRNGVEVRPIFAELHSRADAFDPALRGLIAAVLVEIHPELDDEAEAQFTCRGAATLDPATSVSNLLQEVRERYSWALQFDFSEPASTHFAWVSSIDNEEPRRTARADVAPGTTEHSTDVARRMGVLEADLSNADGNEPIAAFLQRHPHHRFAATRVAATRSFTYDELRDNLLGADHLPLQAQRFQLATYGMHHYSPQSTDWLRVALFGGAPRTRELATRVPLDIALFPLAHDHEGDR